MEWKCHFLRTVWEITMKSMHKCYEFKIINSSQIKIILPQRRFHYLYKCTLFTSGAILIGVPAIPSFESNGTTHS